MALTFSLSREEREHKASSYLILILVPMECSGRGEQISSGFS
jgi:hypothetical protein